MAENTLSEDRVLRELLRTESDMAKETIRLLQSRYNSEKQQWDKVFKGKESDLVALRGKLVETEQRLKQLRDESSWQSHREMEHLKLSVEEIKIRKEKEIEKWQVIENKVRTYRQIADETQSRLLEEQRKLAETREKRLQEEQDFRQQIEKYNGQVVELQNTLLKKEQDWTIDRARYEKEVERLSEQLKTFELVIHDDRTSRDKTIGDKDEHIIRFQKALQDLSVELVQERQRNETLLQEVAERDKRITGLESRNNEIITRIEQERREWQEAWQKQQKEWEEHKKEIIVKEDVIQTQTEEQVSKVMSMLAALEMELDQERRRRKEVEDNNTEKIKQVETLRQEVMRITHRAEEERKKLEGSLFVQEVAFESQRTAILEKYQQLQVEIISLKGALSEEHQVLALEKEKTKGIETAFQQARDNNTRMLNTVEQDKAHWQKVLLEEQIRSEQRLKEYVSLSEQVKKSRETEVRKLQDEITLLSAEMDELRLIYISTKVENDQRKSRIAELEAEFQKIVQQWERERAEWEDLLVNEQQLWERRKNEAILREQRLAGEREKEIKQLMSQLDDARVKFISTRQELHEKENKIYELQLQINGLASSPLAKPT